MRSKYSILLLPKRWWQRFPKGVVVETVQGAAFSQSRPNITSVVTRCASPSLEGWLKVRARLHKLQDAESEEK